MAASYGFAYCSAIVCQHPPNENGSYLFDKSDMWQDATGHFWCDICTRHIELMNWAHENNWPAVRVQGKTRYAIYGTAKEWLTSVMTANQDMVNALYETLIKQTRAPLEPLA